MFQPSWRGKINLQNGLYYSNPKNTMKDTKTNTKNTNTDTINNDNDSDNHIINNNTINNSTYNFTTSEIPYYNENLEYLQNNIYNQNKDNTNYYNLLDRIGYISRYLLKGNDYYRLYISKNSNKYFTNDNDDGDGFIKNDIRKNNITSNTMNNTRNDTRNDTMNDTMNETMNDSINETMNDIIPNKNNRYINKNQK
jgi:hypothetical protein